MRETDEGRPTTASGVGRRAPRMRGSFFSVRARIVVLITLVTALGLAAAGISVYIAERHRIFDEVDHRLSANLDSASHIVAQGLPPDGAAWPSSEEALKAVIQRMSPDDNTGAMGIAEGRIIMLPGIDLDVDLGGEHAFARHVQDAVSDGRARIGTYAEQDAQWRYIAAPITIEGSPAPATVTFVMVYDLAAELAEFDLASGMFLISSIVIVLVVAATSTVLATRLLRPLRQMRETAERVSAQSLKERLPIVGNDDVAGLSATMNQMLDRLNHALRSQRQLLSDVGHELKTPITIVRGHLEVMDPDDAEDVRLTRELTLDELDRMGRLVQDLADAAALLGPSPVVRAAVDLDVLMPQILRKAQGIDGADVSLAAGSASGIAHLDAPRITQAVLQLVQNAVTHGAGAIEVGARTAGPRLQLWVRDHGPGVDDAVKQEVFDRFFRGPGAESRSGSGLGLHIVQVIAGAHGGLATVQDADGGGALFAIDLPTAMDAAMDASGNPPDGAARAAETDRNERVEA
ncbi:sensor histidine kinase [Microbacterium sp. No. 7]|uniref:sensor histidine kinase n=1 Tax=Microbacterium sp. No. 7 TaxID=1714373 RepID=UPI0006D06294|nr:HAMP domain-containing sensor histidine kinase [Microbacterium sp. No. 7]